MKFEWIGIFRVLKSPFLFETCSAKAEGVRVCVCVGGGLMHLRVESYCAIPHIIKDPLDHLYPTND